MLLFKFLLWSYFGFAGRAEFKQASSPKLPLSPA